MSVEFPSTTTLGIIAGLDSTATYQFQVSTTLTVDGTPLMGERNSPVTYDSDGEQTYLYNNNYVHRIPINIEIV